jgi:hypothetical protein
MTEEIWLGCGAPEVMLAFLRDKASERKLRLFAAACAWRVWRRLTDERWREALRLAERCAEGGARKRDLAGARAALRAAGLPEPRRGSGPGNIAWHVVRDDAHGAAAEASNAAAWAAAERVGALGAPSFSGQDQRAERRRQAAVLRDLFGNPFRPAALDAAWLTRNDGAARRLAQALYEERDAENGTLDLAGFAALADALEEAGCADADLLAHCRGRGPHYRGCWAVDLLLGKE